MRRNARRGVGMLVLATTLAAVGALAVQAPARAGDLDPPAGPVAPTFKTLHEVEPRTPLANNIDGVTPIVISQSGSYYLTQDIFIIPGQHGIDIQAEHVTLDLRGFSIRGNLETPGLDGVHTADNLVNVSVFNGSVDQAGQDGVDLTGAKNSVARDLRVSRCGGAGVRVTTNSRVVDCVAWSNGDDGITASWGSVITGCSARENLGDGISAGVGNSITECAAYENGGDGFTSGNGTSLSNCASYLNGGRGYTTPARCSLSNCTASFNTLSGFYSINYNTYLNCSATSNTLHGFEVEGGLIRGCIARANAGGNGMLVSTSVFESVIP